MTAKKLTITYMKKIVAIFLILTSNYFFGQVSISPSTFDVNQQITISVNLSQSQCNSIPISANKVYMHAGIGNDTDAWDYGVVS